MTKENLREILAKFDREQFADWMWRGLKSFYTSAISERRDSFDGAGMLVVQSETPTEGLAIIYEECVPELGQLQFRQAIGDVLRIYGNDEDNFGPAFNDLIYLISRIKANESLSALLSTVGSGRLGKLHPEFFYSTFAVLRSLAPSTQAYNTALQLVNSKNFDEGYLFETLNVLVACEPHRVSEILLSFSARLNDLQNQVIKMDENEIDAFNRAAHNWANHTLRIASIAWITDFITQTRNLADQLWLLEFVFNNKKTSVRCGYEQFSDEFWVESGAQKVPLKIAQIDNKARSYFIEKAIYAVAHETFNPVSKTYQVAKEFKNDWEGVYTQISSWKHGH